MSVKTIPDNRHQSNLDEIPESVLKEIFHNAGEEVREQSQKIKEQFNRELND